MGTIVVGARVTLAIVFAVAGVAKLLDPAGARGSLAGFGVSARAVPAAAVLLALAELATAVVLIPTPSARAGAGAALLLLVAFIAGIARAMARGQAPDCHCFGQLHSAPAGRPTIVRNAALAALAGLVVVDGPGPAIDSWLAARSAAELVAVAATAMAICLSLTALRLRSDRETLRRERDDARAELAALPRGLPVNASAPRFTLPDLTGTARTLQSLLDRGNPLLLVFMSPDCESCGPLLPEIGRWQAMLADRLSIAVITHGSAEDNRASLEEHGIVDVLLQRDTELMKDFRISMTPTAVLLTPQGRVDGRPAEGALAIEPLIRLTLRRRANGATAGARLGQPA